MKILYKIKLSIFVISATLINCVASLAYADCIPAYRGQKVTGGAVAGSLVAGNLATGAALSGAAGGGPALIGAASIYFLLKYEGQYSSRRNILGLLEDSQSPTNPFVRAFALFVQQRLPNVTVAQVGDAINFGNETNAFCSNDELMDHYKILAFVIDYLSLNTDTNQ